MNFIEAPRGSLDFVDDDPPAARLREHLRAQGGRVALVSEHHVGGEEVDDDGVLEAGADPRAFACSPRAEKKKGRARRRQQPWKHRRQFYRKNGGDVASSRFDRQRLPLVVHEVELLYAAERRGGARRNTPPTPQAGSPP